MLRLRFGWLSSGRRADEKTIRNFGRENLRRWPGTAERVHASIQVPQTRQKQNSCSPFQEVIPDKGKLEDKNGWFVSTVINEKRHQNCVTKKKS